MELRKRKLTPFLILAAGCTAGWRLLFLGIAKFKNAINEKNNDWVSCSDKEIFKMANIQKDIIVQSSLFKDLRDAGLIQFSRIVDNLNVRVLLSIKTGMFPIVLMISEI